MTERPTLVLGPSLGTSAATLWAECGSLLTDAFRVLGWDLPGHGTDREPAPTDLRVEDLARRVLDRVDGRFCYAGDSVGGAVGLQLLLDAPDRVTAAVLISTGARVGTPAGWHERAGVARRSGTPALVAMATERWFGPGFVKREPGRVSALLRALSDADDEGYAAVCEALAAFDVRPRLSEIEAPVLAVAGSADIATPVEKLREVADGVRHGRLVVLDGVGHLAPIEQPEDVARLIADHCLARPTETTSEEALS
jgi:3-oxoadipate enol-lactonase / 4-carboxymuconolactone decarboxylase